MLSIYINNENMYIVFLIISNYNYFIELQIQKMHDEFVSHKNFKVDNTEFTDVYPKIETNIGKTYVGLQRKSYFEDKINPRLKSILLPVEAGTTFLTQAIPTFDNAIKEHFATHPPATPPATEKGKKRHYSIGMLTLTLLFN